MNFQKMLQYSVYIIFTLCVCAMNQDPVSEWVCNVKLSLFSETLDLVTLPEYTCFSLKFPSFCFWDTKLYFKLQILFLPELVLDAAAIKGMEIWHQTNICVTPPATPMISQVFEKTMQEMRVLSLFDVNLKKLLLIFLMLCNSGSCKSNCKSSLQSWSWSWTVQSKSWMTSFQNFSNV